MTTTDTAEAAEQILASYNEHVTRAGGPNTYEGRYTAYRLAALDAGQHDGYDLHADAEAFGLDESESA